MSGYLNKFLSFMDKMYSRKTLRGYPLVKAGPKEGESKGWFAVGGFDIMFLILVCVLLTTGIIMMFSASYISAKYSAKTNYDALYYFKRQAIFAVLGVAVMLFVSKINYNKFRSITPYLMILSVFLLLLVLVFPAHIEGKENIKRWLSVPFVGMTIQPSEIAKFGLIMFLAWSFERHQKLIEADRFRATLVYIGIVLAMALLVYMEDHLSGAILMAGIGLVICFLGGGDWRIYAVGILVVGLAVIIVVSAPEKFIKGYMAERINSWLIKDYEDIDARWQTNQSLFALGSGGFFGLGLGNSKQKYLYLPEPQNDFIFAIVGEELGFLGCTIIIIIFALLVWRGFAIALKSRSTFGRLLTMGIVTQIGLQVILNIMVVTDTLPNTGISLPFFSYGGSSLLMLLAEMGVVLSVSRTSRVNKNFKV